MTMLFSIGDTVFVPSQCSLQSMIYYGEHRKEFSCPCNWLHVKAKVVGIKGNFVYVSDLVDPERKTAFYHLDLTLVQQAGAEDGQD